ncbi:uncharacterized protein LOC126898657 [Daktulosphaira vitifoliae]|uniref:uncharacterized protein LOC126898657 n=1 Tax=Daktulosphaira vitifoliae TaxID=58002 RepID=UPI0021A9D9C3|nr:uncharacterized protein LOC126898657 [Daktulosphaira vitifoliae]
MPAIPVYNISAIQKYNSEISDSTHKITISEIGSTLNLKSDFVEDPSTFFLKEKSPTILTKSLAINSSSSSEDSNTSDIENVKSIKKKYTTLYKKEPWITKRLYDFLIRKLEKKYNIYSVKYAEKFLIYLSSILKAMRSDEDANLQMYTDMIRHYMAKHHIIVNNFDYFEFITDYIPKPFYSKLLPTWDLTISPVLFDPRKVYDPIMEDDEFLNQFY